MVVIGHVDAGKSTMMGQLLYQVGHITKRQAMKVSSVGDGVGGKNKSNNKSNNDSNNNNSNGDQQIQWAWLLDEDDGERARGVTMQIATKCISTPRHPQVVILDAPGHADFIPTMITGAANADAGLLVVDASESFEAAFQRGKTKEHVLLARGLGVSQLVVCVNKLDVQGWSQKVFDGIKGQLLPFLTEQANFDPKRIRFVPTSGLTGGNIMPSKASSDASSTVPALREWYQGPTLFEAIDTFEAASHGRLGTSVDAVLYHCYDHVIHTLARCF